MTTRADVRLAASRHIDERSVVVETTTAEGDASHLVCANLMGYGEDHWKDGEVYIVPVGPHDGPPGPPPPGPPDINAGLSRPIIASAGAVVQTIAFPGPIQMGTKFEIRREGGPFVGVINDTITEAVEAVRNWVYIPLVDVSLTYAAGVAEYPVPLPLQLLADVQYRATAADSWTSLPDNGWTVVEGAEALSLTTLGQSKLSAGYALRLIGYAAPVVPPEDAMEFQPALSMSYLVAYTVSNLLPNKAGGPQTDADNHQGRAAFWTQKAGVERQAVRTKTRQSLRRVRW